MRSVLQLSSEGFEKCGDIKKKAQQKTYCEDKYLTTQGEKAVVACFTNFCNICCKDLGGQCIKYCLSSHMDKDCKEQDPEMVFIKVCASQRLVDSMKPFCDKFYKNSQVQLKMCQNSFCNDCCSSELKVSDLKDTEIQKCRGLCLQKIKTSNATIDSLFHHKNKTQLSLNTDKQTDQMQLLQQKQKELEQLKQAKMQQQYKQNEVSEDANNPQQQQQQQQYQYNQCSSYDFNIKQNQFCQSKVNPSDPDYRVQTKENCNSYYCPLCCKNYYKGMEILNCQKECHTSINDFKKRQEGQNHHETDQLEQIVKAIPNLLQSNQPQQQQIQHQQQQIVMKQSEQIIVNDYFNEEELAFMKTICVAFKSKDCYYEICKKMCHDSFQEKEEECLGSCVMRIEKSKDNQQARDILEYFLQKGGSSQGQFLVNNIKNNNEQVSIQQQIEFDKSQINVLHQQMIQLQDHVLQLQKLRFKELQSQTQIS